MIKLLVIALLLSVSPALADPTTDLVRKHVETIRDFNVREMNSLMREMDNLSDKDVTQFKDFLESQQQTPLIALKDFMLDENWLLEDSQDLIVFMGGKRLTDKQIQEMVNESK